MVQSKGWISAMLMFSFWLLFVKIDYISEVLIKKMEHQINEILKIYVFSKSRHSNPLRKEIG